MKSHKILIGILVAIVLGVLAFAVIHDLSKPYADMPKEEERGVYSFDAHGSTIRLPSDYKVSLIRQQPEETFAATSSKVLMTVRVFPDPDHLFASQEEAAGALYSQADPNGSTSENGLTQTSITKEIVGDNYFVIVEGKRTSLDGYNTDYIRQYLVYYVDATYIFDFITPWRDAFSAVDFDAIVSTIQFK